MKLLWPLLLVLATTTIARADGDDSIARQSARDHYRKGSVAYELGHYDLAISEYEAAYRAFNEPSLLYNLGQAHRLAKHLDEALHFYRMYLVKVPDAPNRADVEARINALNAALAAKTPIPASQPTTTPAVTMPTMPTTPSESARTPASALAASAPEAPVAASDRAGRGKRIAGAVVGAAGLAIIAGGIVTGVLAKNASDAVSAADRAHQPYDQAMYNAGKTDQIIEGVLLGVGGAAVVTGVVLFVVGHREAKRAPVATIAPRLSPTSAGLEVRGSF
jgi:tetratricopeptide (TPR) repeat protein